MHFEILAEDLSGKKALDIIVPKIIGDNHTFRVISYKGIGHIPKDLKSTSHPNKRILLDQLPRLLRGYGKTYENIDQSVVVIIVCDLDDQCLKFFRNELLKVLSKCNPKPDARFCVAIEEGEAWFLGDIPAIQTGFPSCKIDVLRTYVNDSICGTWEKLAEAVYPGGENALRQKGYRAIGEEKSKWADRIAKHMNVDNNLSPSFRYFRETLRSFLQT